MSRFAFGVGNRIYWNDDGFYTVYGLFFKAKVVRWRDIREIHTIYYEELWFAGQSLYFNTGKKKDIDYSDYFKNWKEFLEYLPTRLSGFDLEKCRKIWRAEEQIDEFIKIWPDAP